jgi:hypothetical protein
MRKYLSVMTEMVGRVQGTLPGYAYKSLYEYILRNGREMESRTLSKEQLQYLRVITRGGGFPMQQCYGNSQETLLRSDTDHRLEYFEGYATTGLLPVNHGWLVLDGECLVDLTWRRRDAKPRGPILKTRIVGEIPDGYSYFGLNVATRDQIWSRALRTKFWSSLLDDWQNGYPLLRTQPSEEVAT